MRCPRLPAVSIGKAKSKVNKYGVGMPGATLREGFGRAPAVTKAASVPATRARATSSAGLKYKAASDRVCKSQVLSGGRALIAAATMLTNMTITTAATGVNHIMRNG